MPWIVRQERKRGVENTEEKVDESRIITLGNGGDPEHSGSLGL